VAFTSNNSFNIGFKTQTHIIFTTIPKTYQNNVTKIDNYNKIQLRHIFHNAFKTGKNV
jgi:adenosylcobinamide amidohydrolase